MKKRKISTINIMEINSFIYDIYFKTLTYSLLDTYSIIQINKKYYNFYKSFR